MILQPLIENAIVHGIAHKLKGNGLITIVMELKEKKLNIEITDNGIGRKASKIINNNKSYPSSGYSIFEKKIELLQKTHGVNVVYEIQDIENELETGTKVILIIDQYDPLHTN
jgi:LytS/YehU family sensor histidine kinase